MLSPMPCGCSFNTGRDPTEVGRAPGLRGEAGVRHWGQALLKCSLALEDAGV